jgi:putative spermidine/putrescine transport system ATP-binding protein
MSLSVQNLTVTLGKNPILRGVDLDIPAGSFFSLLGPSGCGKSTLLKTVAGLLPQDGGHILWNGEVIDGLPPEKRGMVMVFQDLRLFPHMTVLDNVAFSLKMQGESKTARVRAAREMLARVRLEGLENRRPHQLSGGQQQRTALARALVAKPRALLLDEPFSSLDAPLRADMRALVKQLRQSLGVTMLLVTHDPEEALAMSDAVAVMAAGRVSRYHE